MDKSLSSLPAKARDLLTTSMTWADKFWDESAGLLWSPGNIADLERVNQSGGHTVRDSAWYALGLLLRNGPGDSERAVRVLDVILGRQFNEPDKPYHGTFNRALEEAHPPTPALEWTHYDPNWREFIMTTIAIILIEYEQRLPQALVQKIDVAFARAVEGAQARGLTARYTNIALMNAFMLWFAGTRLGQPQWAADGEKMASDIYRLFKDNDTFEEYNSPTYYGVDLYALALWRAYAGSPLLRKLGKEMEGLLWTDIARYYHAGLRNIAGPYDRSYGMDMRRYVAVVGEWIWLVTGKKQAPLPDLSQPFAHAHDLLFAPAAAILGAKVPRAARQHFIGFQWARRVSRIISNQPERIATAWVGDRVMIGAEKSGGSKKPGAQFHPATIHWRIGTDDVGWLRLLPNQPVDCNARPNMLEITGKGEMVFQICAPGLEPETISFGIWRLPGMTVYVETGVHDIRVEQRGDCMEIHYPAPADQLIEMALLTGK